MSYITDRNYDPKGDTADFDRLYAVNVRGTFFCYKYAAIQMVSQGRGGRIIGASSLTGKKGRKHTSAFLDMLWIAHSVD